MCKNEPVTNQSWHVYVNCMRTSDHDCFDFRAEENWEKKRRNQREFTETISGKMSIVGICFHFSLVFFSVPYCSPNKTGKYFQWKSTRKHKYTSNILIYRNVYTCTIFAMFDIHSVCALLNACHGIMISIPLYTTRRYYGTENRWFFDNFILFLLLEKQRFYYHKITYNMINIYGVCRRCSKEIFARKRAFTYVNYKEDFAAFSRWNQTLYYIWWLRMRARAHINNP